MLFFFLYGPVEVALPVHVARELHASAQLLGAYWTSYALGALTATLVTGALRTGNVRRPARSYWRPSRCWCGRANPRPACASHSIAS